MFTQLYTTRNILFTLLDFLSLLLVILLKGQHVLNLYAYNFK